MNYAEIAENQRLLPLWEYPIAPRAPLRQARNVQVARDYPNGCRNRAATLRPDFSFRRIRRSGLRNCYVATFNRIQVTSGWIHGLDEP